MHYGHCESIFSSLIMLPWWSWSSLPSLPPRWTTNTPLWATGPYYLWLCEPCREQCKMTHYQGANSMGVRIQLSWASWEAQGCHQWPHQHFPAWMLWLPFFTGWLEAAHRSQEHPQCKSFNGPASKVLILAQSSLMDLSRSTRKLVLSRLQMSTKHLKT